MAILIMIAPASSAPRCRRPTGTKPKRLRSLRESDLERSCRMQLDNRFRIDPQMMPSASWQNREDRGGQCLSVSRVGFLPERHSRFAGNDCQELVGRMRMRGKLVASGKLEAQHKWTAFRGVAREYRDLRTRRHALRRRPFKRVRLDNGAPSADCAA